MNKDVTIRDILKAYQRIASVVTPSPLIPSPSLSHKMQAAVFLKLETLHPTGSFKIRGAANKILHLSPAEQQRGVTTFSTGNHGLAVAYLARQLGIPSVICISERVPAAKAESIRRLGARLSVGGSSQDEAEQTCYRLQEQEGLTVIPPFDDPDVAAGQGTIGLELLERAPDLDAVLVPLSGGGLISGIGMTLKALAPEIRVIGISMEGSAVMAESLKVGRPVVLPEQETLADSLLGGIGLNNRYTFRWVQQYVDEVNLVSEEAIARGMAFMLREHRMAVEGAAATGIAHLLQHPSGWRGRNIAVIVSGHNVDITAWMEAIHPHLKEDK